MMTTLNAIRSVTLFASTRLANRDRRKPRRILSHINFIRWSSGLPLYNIINYGSENLVKHERRISKILDKASFDDIAIISMSYFKSETQIRNCDILKKIIDRTVKLIPYIDAEKPSYCSIIKTIRYSRNFDCRESVVNLVMKLMEEPNSHIIFSSPYNTVHTIKMMETYRIYEPKLLDYVYKTLFENLVQYRIKDIQYALTSLSNFSFKDLVLDSQMRKDFRGLSRQIVSETRSDTSKQSYHIMPLLRAFSIFGFYDDILINYVNELLKKPTEVLDMSRVLEFDRTALLIYVASRLEGNKEKLGSSVDLFKTISDRLQRYGNVGSVRQDSSIKHLDFVLKGAEISKNLYVNSQSYRATAISLASTEELKDSDYKFNFQYTLPHQNYADLIISKGCHEPGQFDSETLLPKQVPIGQRHCLILGTRLYDYVDGHNRLSGYKRFIHRLLTKIGYTVITVDFDKPDPKSTALKIKSVLDNTSV